MSTDIQSSAFEVTNQLASDIFDPTISVKPLTGFRGIYRAVVAKDYRIIFSFDDENLYLLRIGHRRDIYRNLEL